MNLALIIVISQFGKSLDCKTARYGQASRGESVAKSRLSYLILRIDLLENSLFYSDTIIITLT
jgi:hypothetical protein